MSCCPLRRCGGVVSNFRRKLLWICALDFIDLLSLLEELERRHCCYVACLRDILRLVDVAFRKDYGAGGFMGLCELVEYWGNDFAWTAPGCVEVDDEERVSLELVELR